MTYPVWWSSLLKICILFHFFSSFSNWGLSTVTAMTRSGQARILAGLRRSCYSSPTVRSPWSVIFFKSPFPRFSPVWKLSEVLLLFSVQSNQQRASSTETISVLLSWNAHFSWRMRKSYSAKQRLRLTCFTNKSGNFALNAPISLIASNSIKMAYC